MQNLLRRNIKPFVRDSGLLHRLLQIDDFNSLLGNPVFGSSWEGLVIENIISIFFDCKFSFYRSASGEELDLVIEKGAKKIAIECKASSAPRVNKNFWKALDTVEPDQVYIVAPVPSSYPIEKKVEVCSLPDVIKKLHQVMTR